VLANSIAQQLDAEGLHIDPNWERPTEERGLGSDVHEAFVSFVSSAAFAIVTAGVAKVRKSMVKGSLEIVEPPPAGEDDEAVDRDAP
jgi:hypothetical protein